MHKLVTQGQCRLGHYVLAVQQQGGHLAQSPAQRGAGHGQPHALPKRCGQGLYKAALRHAIGRHRVDGPLHIVACQCKPDQPQRIGQVDPRRGLAAMPQHGAQAKASAQSLQRVGTAAVAQHHPQAQAHYAHTQCFGAPGLVLDGGAQVGLKLARAWWRGFIKRLHRGVG